MNNTPKIVLCLALEVMMMISAMLDINTARDILVKTGGKHVFQFILYYYFHIKKRGEKT